MVALRAQTPVEPQYVKASQLAVMLSVSLRTFRTWVVLGKLPAAREICGVQRWDLREIHDWIHAGSPPQKRWEEMKANK